MAERCDLWRGQTVLEHGGSFAGVNRKVQLKPLRWAPPEEGSPDPPRIMEALLILKHGGVLTHAGRQQVCLCTRSFPHVRAPVRRTSSDAPGSMISHASSRWRYRLLFRGASSFSLQALYQDTCAWP